jgi:hypothetical protein
MTTPLKTPFGTFQGKHLDGVTQYRGINYAILRDQLSMPEILTEYPNEVIDATHFGSVVSFTFSHFSSTLDSVLFDTR